MEVAVLGAGKMGGQAAQNLASYDEISEVKILDYDQETLDELEQTHSDIIGHQADLKNDPVAPEIENYDAALVALPFRDMDYNAIEEAIEAETNTVDILEEYHRRPSDDVETPDGMSLEEYGDFLHRDAKDSDTMIVSGCGLAPGLTNITVGKGVKELDNAVKGAARVGGIPEKEVADENPLGYACTWSLHHVWREYDVDAEVIRDGEFDMVDSLSEYNQFTFDALGREDELECFVTPGMPSIPYTRDLESFEEKTIRWPGHRDTVEEFKELNMLSGDPIEVDGSEVKPRRVLTEAAKDELTLEEDEKDVANMWNSVAGYKDGEPVQINHFMWEEAENGQSAMARTTASTAAVITKEVAKGNMDGSGIVAPEDIVTGEHYNEFIEEMDKRYDVQIEERVQKLEGL